MGCWEMLNHQLSRMGREGAAYTHLFITHFTPTIAEIASIPNLWLPQTNDSSSAMKVGCYSVFLKEQEEGEATVTYDGITLVHE